MNPLMVGVPDPEPGGDGDQRLLVAARDDPSVFTEVYARNADLVLAYFYRRIACPVTSYELTAETFAQAFASLHRYQPTSSPGVAWIFGIAKNLHLQWQRRAVVSDKARRRLRVETPTVSYDDLEHVESLVDFAPLRKDLEAALGALNDTLRQAVLLRIVGELSYAEVAEVLGCSVGAARVRVSRGLERLYRLMEDA